MSERDTAAMLASKPETAGTELSAMERLREANEQLKRLLDDPIFRTGAEATARTAINAMIAVADMFPIVGGIGSFAADATKVWAHYKYRFDRARVIKAGGDPSKVKYSKIDLTPDVSVALAVGTEVFEVIGAGAVSTHAIETVAQIRHDLPRIKKAFARFREVVAYKADISAEEMEAAMVFDVNLE